MCKLVDCSKRWLDGTGRKRGSDHITNDIHFIYPSSMFLMRRVAASSLVEAAGFYQARLHPDPTGIPNPYGSWVIGDIWVRQRGDRYIATSLHRYTPLLPVRADKAILHNASTCRSSNLHLHFSHLADSIIQSYLRSSNLCGTIYLSRSPSLYISVNSIPSPVPLCLCAYLGICLCDCQTSLS